jgi:hypothetical protein
MTLTISELGEILHGSEIYRCKSETCADNGGVCVLIVPDGFEHPVGCTNPLSFAVVDTDCDCEWEKVA